MEEYCAGCDDLRPVTEAEIKRLSRGDIEFVCKDCRTRNINKTATPKGRKR